MKNFKLIIFIWFVIEVFFIKNGFGQRNGFNSYTDDFLKVEMKEFACNVNSKESHSPINSAHFFFQNDGRNITLFATFNKSLSSFFPDHDLFLMVDDEIFKIPIKAFENEISKYPMTSSSEVRVDSVKVNTVTTTTYIDLNYVKIKIELPVHIQLKIFNADALSFRIYSGGQSNTFKINDVRKLKKVLE